MGATEPQMLPTRLPARTSRKDSGDGSGAPELEFVE